MRLTSTIATAPLRISNTTGGQSFLGHRGGAIGAGSPVGEQILDSANRGTQLAIIGAGAAGLAAGYEMMKLGLHRSASATGMLVTRMVMCSKL